MAASNIVGTHALEVALFLPADVAYAEGPIFSVLDEVSVLLAGRWQRPRHRRMVWW